VLEEKTLQNKKVRREGIAAPLNTENVRVLKGLEHYVPAF
jgi:hypothetical protein